MAASDPSSASTTRRAGDEPPLARATLSAQVAERIIEQILADGLGVGDPIPSENELAERFGVNRLVVREAIRILAAQEVLVASQGRQARVTIPSARVLAQLLRFRVSQQSLAIDDLMATRRLIEQETARRAAERVAAGQPVAPELAEALARMREQPDEREGFVERDVGFHRAIAAMSGNAFLELLLASMEEVLLGARRASWDGRERAGGGHESTLAAHGEILEAIAAGDADRAAAAMRSHLDATQGDLRNAG